jgi:transposase
MRTESPRTEPTCPRCQELCEHVLVLCEEGRALRDQARTLHDQVRTLHEKNRELAEALEKATRAGKRQAAPFSRGKKKENPKKRGRKKGHPGARRENPKQVDRTLQAPPLCSCPDCDGSLEKLKDEINYQTDIPPIEALVTLFLFQSAWCPRCQSRVFSHHDEQTSTATGAASHHLGPNVLAFAADLKARLGIPYRKIVDILWHTFKIKVTAGALVSANERLARRAAPTMKEMKKALSQESLVSADETGWRVAATSWWLWVVCSEVFTIYEIVPHRCATVVQQILGEDFKGLLMRDGWRSYDTRLNCAMLRCLLHLKRNAQTLEDGQSGTAAEDIGLFVLWLEGVFDLRSRSDELTDEDYAREATELIAWLDEFTQADHVSESNSRFASRLHEIRGHIVPIVNDPNLPATNSLGERQIRPAVIHRKISAGNKTEKGAQTLATLSSLTATSRQQGRNLTGILRALLTCRIGESIPFWTWPLSSEMQ